MKHFNFREIQRFLDSVSEESKIYIGCDSIAYKNTKGVWFSDFYSVVVVHRDCCHGCKIFGEITTEPDYSQNKRKPTYRLMQEVYKVSSLFLKLSEITEKEIEIHIDVNPDKKHASNLIIDQAIGYIKGTCNVIPMVKPGSWAATHCADKLLRNRSYATNKL